MIDSRLIAIPMIILEDQFEKKRCLFCVVVIMQLFDEEKCLGKRKKDHTVWRGRKFLVFLPSCLKNQCLCYVRRSEETTSLGLPLEC